VGNVFRTQIKGLEKVDAVFVHLIVACHRASFEFLGYKTLQRLYPIGKRLFSWVG
jgi:hypothetical protein